MKNYELLAVLPGTLTETEAHEIAGQIKDAVEKNGGSSLAMEYNGKSRLSYPMRHIRYGYFFLFTFEAIEKDIQVIQQKIRLVPQVLRFLCKIYNPAQKVSLNLGEAAPAVAEIGVNEEKKEEIIVQEVPEMQLEQLPPTPSVSESVEAPVEPKKESKKAAKSDISMEEIDQKLDELLLKSDV
ncbi:MAG: 30S ribosomal protein S6 [Candidatus Magasanikbacteria bacterium RIFCSPHIGHO2_02_FULL_41_13]|uniref:Small ribosomal subunit protein bS6 n=1 Tax=Candidatus Magasanikbacteria bacterium RIFCSPHIGHO2_02_FULL_41_13 TaxID=1798676 RepID=A0A1F6M302_9BACT|nr:MAG: 30S ribosomal protein S6 [Candidatus Magasanikbacteria bacterium RIFCSPHIGHO2_02_FULL_41_13]